jgi:hypothetical protein
MQEEKIKELLNELADRTIEPVRDGLDEDIKRRIPQSLAPHRGGWDTINIIIDLRVSRLAAAAVIIITMVLLANFFGNRDSAGEGIYQDSKLLIKYLGGKGTRGSPDLSEAEMSGFYRSLAERGREVTYYGGSIDPADKDAVLMHWKLPDGSYKVIFNNLRIEVVSAEDLVRLQARMLQNKSNR